MTLHNIDDLELAEHMSQVIFQLFSLPVTELLISVFVVKRHGLISFNYLCAVCLLLVALHDSNDGLVPGNVRRCDQILPRLPRHLVKEAVLGHENQIRACFAELLVHDGAGLVGDEYHLQSMLP